MADSTPTIPVLHVFHNQDAILYRAKIREDKVYLKGEKVPQFTNRGVFTVKDVTGRNKRKFKMLIYLDGKADTATPTNGKDMKAKILAENTASAKMVGKKVEDVINLASLQTIPDNVELLFEPLTFKDRITIVIREIAKQLGKFKPMETWQFIVIIALIIGGYIVNFIF